MPGWSNLNRTLVTLPFFLLAAATILPQFVTPAAANSNLSQENPCQDQRLVPFATCHACWDGAREVEYTDVEALHHTVPVGRMLLVTNCQETEAPQ